MLTEDEFTYRSGPVFLAVRSNNVGLRKRLLDRLCNFFDVDSDSVVSASSETIDSYVVDGATLPIAGRWCAVNDRGLAATSHPIVHDLTLGDETGDGLLAFSQLLSNRPEMAMQLGAPVAVLHHDVKNDRVSATNDTFGIGRLYYRDLGDVAVIANSVAAVALATDGVESEDEDYWSSYYVSGGGVASSTHIRNVHRLDPGARIVIDNEGLRARETHSIGLVLTNARDREANPQAPLEAATRMLDAAAPFFKNPITLGLSGGRDSRFVLAAALRAGMNVRAFTATPPDLEAEIAEELHQASSIPFDWSRKSQPRTSQGKSVVPPTKSILDRANDWFAYTGGDNWATFVRRDPLVGGRKFTKAFSLSGAYGDFTRGHYYLEAHLKAGGPELAVNRFLTGFTKKPTIVPEPVRLAGAENVAATLRNFGERGFHGYYALDYSFLINRVRRQLPNPGTGVLLPLLTSEMAAAVFWAPPGEKLNSRPIMELTSAIMPEWARIPYFHERAVGMDPAVVNKVTIQPTYWEVDRDDFLSAAEASINRIDMLEISMTDVMHDIGALPDGRNRTNSTYEIVFWHYAALEEISRINKLKSSSR